MSEYPLLWTAGKFILALPICYHMVNGVRHLVRDGKKKESEREKGGEQREGGRGGREGEG